MPRQYLVWLQATGLLVGGLLIVLGALLPWIDNDWNNPKGLEFSEGRITFSLGCVAIGLGILRVTGRHRLLGALVTVLGSWLSAAVLTLAVAELMDIRSMGNILAYLPIRVGVGLRVTLVGGSLTAVGSLVGLLPSRPRWLVPPTPDLPTSTCAPQPPSIEVSRRRTS